MVKKLLINLLVMSLCIVSAKAQVTVGATTPPADYAVLQIEGVGGVRLPKLTLAERDALQATFTPQAEGVVIYLSGATPDDSYFQFWDGSQWISMKYISEVVNPENGIHEIDRTLSGDVVTVQYGLGGNLTEDTKITQPTAQLLKFDPNNGGRFTVMNNALVVTKDAVGMGGAPSGSSILEVTGTAAGQAFRYNATNPVAGHVLASDADGYASWVTLKPNIIEKTATINDGSNIATTSLSGSTRISDVLRLERGIWLVMARYIARTNSTAVDANWGKNAWLTLNKTNGTGTILDEIVRVGQVPQWWTTMTATPQLVYILNVAEDADYALYGSMVTNVSTVNMTVRASEAGSGQSYFKAIQLSDDPSY